MPDAQTRFDVLVIGGGPAGIAAACCSSERSSSVGVVDDNPELGGQIWRASENRPGSPESREWFDRFKQAKNVVVMRGTRVFASTQERTLLAEANGGVYEIGFNKLVIAAGARERFVPFPGWTLPNVIGAGGLQALVKSGMPIEGRRVVIAGAGPLLLAVAAFLIEHGAIVPVIAEQASRLDLFRLGLSLATNASKAAQALSLRRKTASTKFIPGCFPVEATGSDRVRSVTLRRGRRELEVSCDYLACGFHLVPNIELAALLNCELIDNTVKVNQLQETSIPGIYCAGESTGIGGLDLAIAEGRIAGYAATGDETNARKILPERAKALRFATALNRAFALRDELKSLPRDNTLVCRCEDVSFGQMRDYGNWRDAKLQTRSGMGPCHRGR